MKTETMNSSPCPWRSNYNLTVTATGFEKSVRIWFQAGGEPALSC